MQKTSVTVDSSTFWSNTGTAGGVIYAISDTSVTVSNSNFSGSQAIHDGGVVFLTKNSMIMIGDSSFWHNEAERGGVIYATEPGNSITITNSSFSSNTVILNGGVLQLIYGGKVLINDSNFDNNSANREGGVLYGLSMESSTTYRSTFMGNKANIGGVFTIRDGSKFFTQDSIFCRNVDIDLGGIIYADNGTNNVIYKCNFMENSGNYGGIVHATRNSNVTVDNCIFDSNIANADGATLYGRAETIITVSSSLFSNNTAVNDAIIQSFVSMVTLEDVIFTNNKAGHDGGAVYVYDSSTLMINRCSFTSNRANNSGGAVYGRKTSIITIIESTVMDCLAQNSGGGVYAQEDSNVTIQSSNFTNNSAYYGGAFHVYIRSTASVTNSRLSENRASQEGGAMNAYQFSTIQMQECIFESNMGDYGGISFVFQGSNLVLEDCEFYNNAAEFDGVIRVHEQSTLIVSRSVFMNNKADIGGVLYVQDSNATIKTTSFNLNSAKQKGGVIYAINSSILNIYSSNFSNNTVDNDGGVMSLLSGTVANVESSTFINNKARSNGGVIGIQESSAISTLNTTFHKSNAGSSGGVIRAINSSILLNCSNFTENSADKNGGIIDARLGSDVQVIWSYFLRNTANKSGGVIYLEEESNARVASSVFQLNKAETKGGVISVTISNIIVTESAFTDNSAQEGGALLAEQNSSISFVETFLNLDNVFKLTAANGIWINNNTALCGGGIFLSESDLFVETDSHLSHNRASLSGGGVFAESTSYINVSSTVHFNNNCAIDGYGGGISAQNASIALGSAIVDFVNNTARFGGGASLANSNLNGITDASVDLYVNFMSNFADYGGALYVNDMLECISYDSQLKIDCFFQNITKGLHFYFNNNSARYKTRGYDLFGGLLDRCTIVSNTQSVLEQDGTSRFKNLSTLMTLDTVYSEPIRMCLCQDGTPDCSLSIPPIEVKQGNEFTIGPIAAVDQVGHPLSATVMSAFSKLDILPANQSIQGVGTSCSNLTYQVTLPSTSKNYQLILHAEGPCGDIGISKFVIDVHILECSCARGFIRNKFDSRCNCICDKDQLFMEYITDCDPLSESVIRQGRFWITYLNESSSNPYFIYPYCPLDYCQPPSKMVPVNLNLPNGSDAQCADNRGGTLCGSCLPDYSLSLGSSKCLKCPAYWHGLLVGIIVAAILVGVILVVFLLLLNLTVAIGTLNSIIFYANIIYANRSLYFTQLRLTFIPVFISWLNLDIGFDTCFFKGMDTYVKTWLQLAFPLYIIFLVIIIIWISSCSSRFSNTLGRRNPVATLTTLILLSYTKLLETIIASLSLVPLNFQNYTTTRWLRDANLEYGKGKHIALIIAAVLILILGLLYTILITFWQWFLYCSRSRLFKCTTNQKLHTFIDTYHIPHTAKHRYWTGMLLLVRVVVYLISTFSVSINPRITLLSIVVIMSCLLSYKTLFMIRVYKNWLLNAMESYVYFNITIFTTVTWYTFGDTENSNIGIFHTIVAYLSAGTVLIMFLSVIAFHMYRYGSTKLYTLGQNSKLGRKVKSYEQDRSHHTPLDSTLLDVMDSPRHDSIGYIPPKSQQPHTPPTSSVVSMTDCEELLTNVSEHPHANGLESAISKTQQQQSIQDDSIRESRSLSGQLTFKSTFTETGISQKNRPMLLSYRAQGTPRTSITEPLLMEDEL